MLAIIFLTKAEKAGGKKMFKMFKNKKSENLVDVNKIAFEEMVVDLEKGIASRVEKAIAILKDDDTVRKVISIPIRIDSRKCVSIAVGRLAPSLTKAFIDESVSIEEVADEFAAAVRADEPYFPLKYVETNDKLYVVGLTQNCSQEAFDPYALRGIVFWRMVSPAKRNWQYKMKVIPFVQNGVEIALEFSYTPIPGREVYESLAEERVFIKTKECTYFLKALQAFLEGFKPVLGRHEVSPEGGFAFTCEVKSI